MFALALAAGVLPAADIAAPQRVVYVYLISHDTDHVNIGMTEDRLHRTLPMLERYAKQHPEFRLSATCLFTGAASETLRERNSQTKIKDFIDEYIRKVSQKKGYDPLPFYTVIFVQPLANGMVRRAARVSQSPQIIQQWVQEMTAPNGAEPNWEAVPRPTRARAILAAEEWMSGS